MLIPAYSRSSGNIFNSLLQIFSVQRITVAISRAFYYENLQGYQRLKLEDLHDILY